MFRFCAVGERSGIDTGVRLSCQAESLTSDGHARKYVRFDILGVMHDRRFIGFGDPTDSDMAIEFQKKSMKRGCISGSL
jgi:hypothetical protein